MQTLAERGRTVMQWLVVLGILASWACLDRAPAVVDTARHLLDRLLVRPESLGLTGDPLQSVPNEASGPLRQYRHQYLHQAFDVDGALVADQRQYLQEVPVGLLIQLARATLQHPEVVSARAQQPIKELLLEPIRKHLARLEVWQQKSGLSDAATLADIEHELATRVQIPGTEQSLELRHCMLFAGLAIIGLQLYLTSLLLTLREEVAQCACAPERSWVIFHRAPLGPLLTILTLALPSAAWLANQILQPLGQLGHSPAAHVWLIAVTVVLVTAMTLRQAVLARQEVLARHISPALPAVPVAQAATPATRNLAA